LKVSYCAPVAPRHIQGRIYKRIESK